MPHELYTGRLPTVADTRRLGVHRIEVECAAKYCHHRGRPFTFDELGLADDTVMIAVEHVRTFRCTKCGSRKAAVHICWDNNRPRGNGSEALALLRKMGKLSLWVLRELAASVRADCFVNGEARTCCERAWRRLAAPFKASSRVRPPFRDKGRRAFMYTSMAPRLFPQPHLARRRSRDVRLK